MTIEVLVFDFDGVLVDSLPVRDEGFRQVFLIYGEEIADQAKAFHVNNRGLFRREKFRRIYEKVLGIAPTEFQLDNAETRFVKYTQQGIMDAPLNPGVAEFCAQPLSIPLYIVSAAPQSEVSMVARHKGIASMFFEILGGPKPKIEHLKMILTRERCSAQSMLFIGDALNDFNAASEVGCRFNGIVKSGNVSPFPDGTQIFNNFHECIKALFPLESIERESKVAPP